MKYKLTVNGEERQIDVDPTTPLLWVLRDDLGLTGTKYSCGISQCGACTVHLDGKPRRSCMLPIRSLGDRKVTTIEGVDGAVAAAVQDSWDEIQVPQCGYCQSGQVMAAIALLEEKAKPDDTDIDDAMSGNLCRCATYPRIRKAVHQAAEKLEG
jgi:isoquinoline 1-oxidoreductase alpha subunit